LKTSIKSINTTRENISKSFGSASKSYDVSSRLQRFSGKYLMPWLPQSKDLTVLDLGCGTGFFTHLLKGNYQQVIGLDMSIKMLDYAKERRSPEIIWVEGDAHNLPLQDESIDFVYSNLVIQWCDPLDEVLKEVCRVLKPGGLFIFSTLVEGTLHELKSSWAQIDDDKHVIDFMAESALTKLLTSPKSVIIEQKCKDIVLEYENVLHLAQELKGLGANHVANQKNKGLAGKNKWFNMIEAYKDFLEPSGIYPATYRVYSGQVVKLNG
jgi:malonyl-CoA O-methyltransferase